VLIGGDAATGAMRRELDHRPGRPRGNAAGVEINGNFISGPLTISSTTGHSAAARYRLGARNREHGSRARADHDTAVCHPQPVGLGRTAGFEQHPLGLAEVELLGRYSKWTYWIDRTDSVLRHVSERSWAPAKRGTVRNLSSEEVVVLVERYRAGHDDRAGGAV
jgi:hypothetical protein